MKKITMLVIATSLLSSCINGFVFEPFDYKSTDAEYVYAHAKEITTVFPINAELKIGETTVGTKSIPQGSKITVLGMVRDESIAAPVSYSPEARYIMESADGTRFVCVLPEACIGLKAIDRESRDTLLITSVRKMQGKSNKKSEYPYTYSAQGSDKEYIYEEIYWRMMRQYPLYNKEGKVKPMQAKQIESKIAGKSLKEAENELSPADQIIVKGNNKQVCFSGISAEADSLIVYPLVITFADDKAVSIDYSHATEKMSGVAVLLIKAMRSTYLNTVYPAKWQIYPRFSFYSTYYMGSKWRIAVSAIITAIFSLLFFAFILPWLVGKLFDIKFLSNSQMLRLCRFVYFAAALWAIIYFTIYMNIISLIFVALFMYAGLYMVKINLRFARCPKCKSVHKLRFAGKSNKRESSSYSDVKTRDRIVREETQGDTTTRFITKVNYRTKYTTKSWRENFVCSVCKYEYHYQEHDTTSVEVGA